MWSPLATGGRPAKSLVLPKGPFRSEKKLFWGAGSMLTQKTPKSTCVGVAPIIIKLGLSQAGGLKGLGMKIAGGFFSLILKFSLCVCIYKDL